MPRISRSAEVGLPGSRAATGGAPCGLMLLSAEGGGGGYVPPPLHEPPLFVGLAAAEIPLGCCGSTTWGAAAGAEVGNCLMGIMAGGPIMGYIIMEPGSIMDMAGEVPGLARGQLGAETSG
eukprot:jgi/Tetstr1/444362/TSEL_032253.t1